MSAGWLRRKILNPVLDLLRQGITPEKIALSIALGITLGVTPVLGSTSILCFLAAVLLRLNLPALQLVNYLVYPLQFALLVPFIRVGGWILSVPPVRITVGEIIALIRADVWNAIATLWTATLHALLAWFMFGSLASLAIYVLLAPVLRRLSQSLQAGTR
ncbi:MAG: DUF2062 domain-containing protein [Acidobacteria bacterium]|nr:DUF2062 domain-containing protein [Acidobacteriota bacterium]